jgi:hypothetical protein
MQKRKGVTKSMSKSKPWRAYVGHGSTFKHLGNFNTFEDAVEARIKAEKNMGSTEVIPEEMMAQIKTKEAWFIKSLKVLQKKFSIPNKIIEVLMEPLTK